MVKFKRIVIGDDGASLEAESDRLLKKNHALNKASGIYTEIQLKRKIRDKEVSIVDCNAVIESSAEIDAMFDCFWQEIMDGARKKKLTPRQIDFLSLRRFRMSTRDIAEATKNTWGVSYVVVSQDLKDATEKITDIPEFGIISVLAEVFKTSIERIKAILFYS